MLTRWDLRWNYRAFALVSALNLMPVEFETAGGLGRVSTRRSWIRRGLFHGWQIGSGLYLTFMTIRILQSAFFAYSDWNFIPFNIMLFNCFVNAALIISLNFNVHLNLLHKVYNEILLIRDQFEAASKSGSKSKENTKTKSVMEWFLCIFPIGFYSLLIAYPTLYILNPEIPFLAISVFPPASRHFTIIILCLSLDMTFHIVYITAALYPIFIVVSFIMTYCECADWLIRESGENHSGSGKKRINEEKKQEHHQQDSNSNPDLIECLDVVQEPEPAERDLIVTKFQQLEMQLFFFNLALANVLWLVKLALLGMSIMGGFSAIRLAHDHPILALVYSVWAVEGIVMYISIFKDAFQITEVSERVRRVIQLETVAEGQKYTGLEQKYRRARLRAVPRLAIFVGHFHSVERESVLIFVSFVINQIVSLLLAF